MSCCNSIKVFLERHNYSIDPPKIDFEAIFLD
ncbi:MAG: hypothetical protein ACI8RD_014322, partial [Bacillariaceae sp.]